MGEPSHIIRSSIFILLFLNFLILWTSTTSALTNLDYHLGQSKYGDASVSGEKSFHGSNSAKLSVDSKGNYIRVSIYMDEPLLLDDLDLFSMWINPQTGNGKIQLELFLDGDGDDSYDSDSSSDVSLRSLQKSWSDLEMSYSQWNELDGFDLEYEKYGDKKFAPGSLEDCISKLDGKSVVKLYITFYKDKNIPNTATFVDYLKFGDEIISFEPLEEEDVKNAPKSVSQGGQITYTITYGNNQLEPVNLVVREDYDLRTIFVEAYPMPDPGTNNVWTFQNLPPGAHGQIVIKMKTSKPTCKAKIEGEVSGLGYASTDGFLSTNSESYQVTNNVAITSGEYNFTDSTTTAVRPIVGSTLNYGAHGSGFYHASEELAYSPASIFAEREINGSTVPVFVNFSKHLMPFQGSWFADLQAENRVRDIRWSDNYYQASLINQSSRVQLGKTLSYLETSSHFVGLLDRTTEWPGGITDQRLAGNFTLQGKARWRQTNKTVSPEKEGLDCCPLIPGQT